MRERQRAEGRMNRIRGEEEIDRMDRTDRIGGGE